jgi:hypothetical protein
MTAQKLHDYRGERVTITELALRHGIKPGTVHSRMRMMGWSLEKALHEPARPAPKKPPPRTPLIRKGLVKLYVGPCTNCCARPVYWPGAKGVPGIICDPCGEAIRAADTLRKAA